MPVLTALALIGFVLAVVSRKHLHSECELLAFALACAVAIGTRIALLAYLEVTSIPSVNILYLSPASPFFITFVVIGIYLLILSVSGMVKRKSAVPHDRQTSPESPGANPEASRKPSAS
jgi:hypothetical protein